MRSLQTRLIHYRIFGNRFAYFEFAQPKGGQIIRHRFTVKTWQMEWDIEPEKVISVARWPASFAHYLRSDTLVPTDGRFAELARSIVRDKTNPARDLVQLMDWVSSS